MIAKSIASGITDATSSPALRLPRNNNQDEDHDQRPFHQVFFNGAYGVVDHLGPVQECLDHDPFGQCLLDLLQCAVLTLRDHLRCCWRP
jgi:hypothetical protein